jgi:hypothetical protein
MPAQQTERDYLIASGAAALAVAELTSLTPAVQAEVDLGDLIGHLRWEPGTTDSLAFRPSRQNLTRLIVACQAWPEDLGLTWPWDFSDSGQRGYPDWELPGDGPARPTDVVIGLEASNPLYINLGCACVTTTRAGVSLANPAAIEIWQATGGDLHLIKTGSANGMQIGPFPAGQRVTLTLIARDAEGRASYPTAFVSATPYAS